MKVTLTLVPVQVFGGCGHSDEEGHDPFCEKWSYGFMDAVSSWSDCNRARGHIFRVEDLGPISDPDRHTIQIEVDEADLWFFKKNWDEP